MSKTAAASGAASGFDPWQYDLDGDGKISLTEALRAVHDQATGAITEAQRDEVVALWKQSAKPSFDPWRYAEEEDGMLYMTELSYSAAVRDYGTGLITQEQFQEVVSLVQMGTTKGIPVRMWLKEN